ncbi:hypothetical protein CDAR_579511 [Caerostris darwini]|uniref:Uncharacterized protein n=1 Tax=Caerostris darwini TaxID=1538125 RepID=A0AAV4V3A0_9ARAC|nr:hypothetical protein CDAR_579511 [Caerostris darwini]
MLALNRHFRRVTSSNPLRFVFQAFIGSLSYPFCDKGEWAQRTRRFSRGWGNVTFSVFTFGRLTNAGLKSTFFAELPLPITSLCLPGFYGVPFLSVSATKGDGHKGPVVCRRGRGGSNFLSLHSDGLKEGGAGLGDVSKHFWELCGCLYIKHLFQEDLRFRQGVVAKIPGSRPGGPGSIPGVRNTFRA